MKGAVCSACKSEPCAPQPANGIGLGGMARARMPAALSRCGAGSSTCAPAPIATILISVGLSTLLYNLCCHQVCWVTRKHTPIQAWHPDTHSTAAAMPAGPKSRRQEIFCMLRRGMVRAQSLRDPDQHLYHRALAVLEERKLRHGNEATQLHK